MKVCIAEKPSAGRTIARVLSATHEHDGYMEGNGYQVTWAFGHLCELYAPEDYNNSLKHWSLAPLPIVPKELKIRLIDDPGIKKQFKVIRRLFVTADEIINCGDAGQEGEVIQRWIQELAGVKDGKRLTIKRLWISSLTDQAIKNGFENLHLKKEFDNLYEAGLTRAKADWLLGMTCTRLYTLKFGGEGPVVSIGRVQTPTLAYIVSRYKAIRDFKPENYGSLVTNYRGTLFTADTGRIMKKADADALIKKVTGKSFVIRGSERKECAECAPRLYDLGALQVDANKRYGYTAARTLAILQVLYEHRLTTYPRVDTRYLTDDLYAECPRILSSLFGFEAFVQALDLLNLRRDARIFNTAKVTDHHAIIPTGVRPGDLTDCEQKVYDLVCRRFIAAFMPDSVYATTTVTATAGGVTFKVTGRESISEGWRTIYKNVAPADPAQPQKKNLPHFTEKERGEHSPKLQQKQTTPPKPLTDATLLQFMETAGRYVDDEELSAALKENGIGRPSSRVAIIDTLFKRHYAYRTDNGIEPTRRGIEVIEHIQEKLLISVETTGLWE